MTATEQYVKGAYVETDIGRRPTDAEGSPVCGARMDTSRAYAGIPGLLQKVIDDDDTAAWAAITEKIDYIYTHIGYALDSLDRETGFIAGRSGKKGAGSHITAQPRHRRRPPGAAQPTGVRFVTPDQPGPLSSILFAFISFARPMRYSSSTSSPAVPQAPLLHASSCSLQQSCSMRLRSSIE